MQHAWKHVERPGESYTALDGKKKPALIVFVGDHRQTPGGLSKGRAAAVNRQKLLHRPLGLRAYQWEPSSNGSATQESTVTQPYVC